MVSKIAVPFFPAALVPPWVPKPKILRLRVENSLRKGAIRVLCKESKWKGSRRVIPLNPERPRRSTLYPILNPNLESELPTSSKGKELHLPSCIPDFVAEVLRDLEHGICHFDLLRTVDLGI